MKWNLMIKWFSNSNLFLSVYSWQIVKLNMKRLVSAYISFSLNYTPRQKTDTKSTWCPNSIPTILVHVQNESIWKTKTFLCGQITWKISCFSLIRNPPGSHFLSFTQIGDWPGCYTHTQNHMRISVGYSARLLTCAPRRSIVLQFFWSARKCL